MAEAKKLGEILLEEGMITEDQLDKAIGEQAKTSESLGSILVRLGFITEDVMYHFLAMQFGTKFIDVNMLHIEEDVIKVITRDIALKYRIMPIEKKPGKIIFATSNPLDPALQMNLKYDIVLKEDYEYSFVVTSESSLMAAVEKYYATSSALDETIKSVEGENFDIEIIEEKKEREEEAEEGDISGEGSPVVKYVNYLIEDAVRKRASDIHINPYEKKIVLRYRVDGALVEMPPPKIQFRRALTSRIKLLGGMNIIEKRKPQDGRMKFTLSNSKAIDLRVSVVPSIWGENIVMRVINQEAQSLELKDLGLFEFQQKDLEKSLNNPYGMVLITGPTACGKTTSVYGALTHINDPHDNILTVEDPVEYRLPHIIQIQVNPEAGLTFANVLRSFFKAGPGYNACRGNPRRRNSFNRGQSSAYRTPRAVNAAYKRRPHDNSKAGGHENRPDLCRVVGINILFPEACTEDMRKLQRKNKGN